MLKQIGIGQAEENVAIFLPSFEGCVRDRVRWTMKGTISTGTIRSVTKRIASETTIL